MRISFDASSKVTLMRHLEDDAVTIQFKTGDDTVEVTVDNIQAAGLAHALNDWAKRSRENEALAMKEYRLPVRAAAEEIDPRWLEEFAEPMEPVTAGATTDCEPSF